VGAPNADNFTAEPGQPIRDPELVLKCRQAVLHNATRERSAGAALLRLLAMNDVIPGLVVVLRPGKEGLYSHTHAPGDARGWEALAASGFSSKGVWVYFCSYSVPTTDHGGGGFK
jgi:hypothetical protein